jgi:EAL domain-containing protein (putative c-di-GMP-specific phosphodiesterase class I)
MEGHLFPLETGDVFFLVKDATPTILESAVDRIRALFSQDPLADDKDENGKPLFYDWYDLEKDYSELLDRAKNVLREAEERREAEENTPIIYKKEDEEIRPVLLSRLEQSLENVDATNIARRQSVCTLIDGHPPQPLFEEVFISINDLEKVVSPGVDLDSNPWLFRYLTKTLDKRVMLMLIRDGISTSRPFSLNLNVSTVLTPEFARFENVIAPQLKGRLVIEMNKLDVFSDMGAFLFARDYLHEHGFRLCLDGLTHHTLAYYDRAKLGFDLVKLFWSPNAIDTMPRSRIMDVRTLVMDTGQAHTILCRCDDNRALETGQELGIVMFQGREVDRLITNTRRTPPARIRV